MREHCTLTKSEMSGFEEAKTLVAIEDDVVQQSNAEDITSCLHLRGDLHISGARFRAGCRLVVGHDHGGGAISSTRWRTVRVGARGARSTYERRQREHEYD